MQDVSIRLENRPGALAEMGEALARAGISIEGGGAWVVAAGARRISCSRMANVRASRSRPPISTCLPFATSSCSVSNRPYPASSAN